MTQFSDPLYLGGAPTLISSNFNGGLGIGPMSGVYVYDVIPTAATANSVALTQTTAGAGALVLTAGTGITSVIRADGTTVLQFDIARNVTFTSAGNLSAITFTVSGYDIYGQAMTQTLAGPNATTNGTTKAFFQVASIAVSATVGTAVTAGNGSVLGLPFLTPQVGYIGSVSWAGALGDDTGTFVAGDATSPATSATGDVRGTYTPSTATDGTRRLNLHLMFTQAAMSASATRIQALGVDQV